MLSNEFALPCFSFQRSSLFWDTRAPARNYVARQVRLAPEAEQLVGLSIIMTTAVRGGLFQQRSPPQLGDSRRGPAEFENNVSSSDPLCSAKGLLWHNEGARFRARTSTGRLNQPTEARDFLKLVEVEPGKLLGLTARSLSVVVPRRKTNVLHAIWLGSLPAGSSESGRSTSPLWLFQLHLLD